MEKELVASEDKVVCGACGSDEVEEAVWRTINGDEYVDHVDDLSHYCPMCEDDCDTVLKSQYDDYILRKWREVARSASASVKVEITQELAYEMEQESLIGGETCEEVILEYVLDLHSGKEPPRIHIFNEMEDGSWKKIHEDENETAHATVEQEGYGLHPSEVNWDSLSATRSRGFPVGKRTEVPYELTSTEHDEPGMDTPLLYQTNSDVWGIQSKINKQMFVPYNLIWGVPNIHYTPSMMSTKVEQLSTDLSPCSLTNWIHKPISTIGDK